MKKVLLIAYLSVMLSLVLAFAFTTWKDYDDPLVSYEHTVSVITDDMYDQLILDGWVYEDTIIVLTDSIRIMTYEDLSLNVSTLYVKVVDVP